MSKVARQSVVLFLLAVALGVLTWRLWPDAGQASRQQRNRALFQEVTANHLAAATRLLDEGADPNAQKPPFSFAQKGKMYYFWASHGIKPPAWGQVDDTYIGWSMLQLAAMRGNAELVDVLLSKGADVNYRNKIGDTALSRVQGMKGRMSPAAWNASSYPRIVALLKAAEARRTAPTPVPSPVGTREGSKSRKG